MKAPPECDIIMPHGTFRGKRLVALPMFYLQWLAKNWNGNIIRDGARAVVAFRESMNSTAKLPAPKFPSVAAVEKAANARRPAPRKPTGPASYSAADCAGAELKALLDKTPADAF